jgi:hypothetical protein
MRCSVALCRHGNNRMEIEMWTARVVVDEIAIDDVIC